MSAIRFNSLARSAAVGVMLLGASALAGWLFDIALLKSVLPGHATMKANTALGLALAGLSLMLQATPAPPPGKAITARACGLAVLMIGALTLAQYPWGVNLGIDQLLFQAPAHEAGTPSPGRMPLNTALGFVLVGSILAFLDSGGAGVRKALQAPTVLLFLFAFIALCGHAFNVTSLYGVSGYASMAVHTAAGFAMLSVGILFARPERGFMTSLAQDNPAGFAARRLAPLVLVTPFLVGWMQLQGERAGFYGTEFGLALMVCACTAIFLTVVLWSAAVQGASDAERRRAQERFELVVEAAPNAILMVDGHGRINMVNRRVEELFGYDRHALIGQPVEILVPRRFCDRHPGFVQAFFTAPAARAMGAGRDLFCRRADGSEVPVEIGLNPISTPQGMFTLASIIDISERKRAEGAMQRLAAIVEYSEDAILSKTVDGIIASWNHGAQSLFGYTAQEAVGQPVLMLVPERLADEELRQIEQVARDKRTAQFESVRRRKDGSEVEVSVRLSPIRNSAGQVVAESSITRDITEIKQRAAELKRSNAELEQFAYVASHDLQEPLRMVANYTELLAQRYRGQLDEKAEKYIFYASDGARRMQRLVSDLLEYSRVGSQGKPMVPVDCNTVLDSVRHNLQRLIREADAQITNAPLPHVLADETQMRQLFQNLVSNAIKFRADAPLIVHVQAAQRGALWEFSVADNGIGLDMRHAERIFQMFQRLHELDKFEGSGIGLAIAKRIVERHGGTIEVQSRMGAGTTFLFTLKAIPKGLP